MTTTAQILGQSKPAAATYATLITADGSNQTQAVLYITNQGSAQDTYHVALVLAGGAVNPPLAAAFIGYAVAIPVGITDKFDGICLNVNEMLVVYSTLGYCSFVATGLKIS